MKIEIKEMPRASEGDSIELEGKVIRALKPNSNDFEGKVVWSQFIVIKDSTGEQGCWLKLDGEEDKIAKGVSIKVKGKVGKDYEDSKGKTQRSINNCEFEVKGGSPKESSTKGNGYVDAKEEYWAKKFEWDKKVHFSIVRECAIKAVTELAKITPSKTFLIKVHTEKDFFKFADKIKDYILKRITSEDIKKEFGGTTKEERIEAAREVVGETEFRPASTLQKNKIFGYRNKEGWHKGMIESRYITKQEIRDIGSPDKLSVESASEWLGMWWGVGEEIGERAKREIENPRDENGTPLSELSGPEPLVKGDKTSLVKDILVDEVSALRRENFLSDDVKFKKEMGYNPKLEELSEEDLTKLKEILKHYHPASWDEKEK